MKNIKAYEKWIKQAVKKAKRDLLYGISLKEIYEIYKHSKENNLTKNEQRSIFWWNIADIGNTTRKGLDRFEVYKIIEIYYEEQHGKNRFRRIHARYNGEFYSRVKYGDEIGYFFGY